MHKIFSNLRHGSTSSLVNLHHHSPELYQILPVVHPQSSPPGILKLLDLLELLGLLEFLPLLASCELFNHLLGIGFVFEIRIVIATS